MSPSLLDFVDVAPVLVTTSLQLLYGMDIRSAFVYPLNGGVETIAIIRGYAETVAGLSFGVRVATVIAIAVVFWAHIGPIRSGFVFDLKTHTSHGSSLIPRSRTRFSGLPNTKIGY